MSPLGDVEQALRKGLFAQALTLLSQSPTLSASARTTRAEALFQSGEAKKAAKEAEVLIARGDLAPVDAARCTAIRAEERWYSGDFVTAADLHRHALVLAEQSEDLRQVCLSAATVLERTSDRRGLDHSFALSARVRKLARRSGDAHLIVSTHLTFGRLEAKRGRFDVARRHFGVGRRLLHDEPNAWLSAAADIDESAVLSLCGDVTGAVELAKRGAAQAGISGWSRGKVAAAGNLAFCYVALGLFREAEDELSKTEREPFSSPSILLAFADTRARASLAQGDTRRAELLLDRRPDHLRSVQRWYDIVALSTRVRALLMREDFVAALCLAEEGLASAESAQMDDAVVAFSFMRAEARIGALKEVQPSSLLTEAHTGWSPTMLADRRLVLSKIFSSRQQADRAQLELARAARVYKGCGMLLGAPREVRNAVPSAPAPPTLDSAVALLELAGHPHILGREAFAILEGAGCCTQMALLAVGPAGARAVLAAGWADGEAVAAFERATPDDLTVLGMHRDETWQLLVRARPDIDDHCTVAAVRKLVATARTLDRYRRDEQERSALWPAEALDGDPESLWISEQSAELHSNARRIASNPSPVLITGETGTGKEMLARAIHRASHRAERPLQAFNCSAVPRDMLESQLFGHTRGAFTGADSASPGVIRAAAGGTLFLDEIAELNLELQPKLLRFLDRHEIHPLGEPHPIKVDVRVIAATNADLERLVAEGRFREDLFHRLNVIRLRIPPLRERREEIPPLVEHYLRRISVEQKKGSLSITDEVLEYLVLYNWTGNLRQLANEVRRMVAFADRDAAITPDLLSPEILASRRTIAASSHDAELRVRLDQPLPAAVAQLEQTMVRRALDRSHGRVEEASRLLGISRKGLFLKRRRWGLCEASDSLP